MSARTIRVSEEVWKAFQEKGKFGDTPESIIRRELHMGALPQAMPRQRQAARRISAQVVKNELVIQVEGEEPVKYALPHKNKPAEIRKVRDEAVGYVEEFGATLGQVNAVKKALTSAGYRLAVIVR